MRMIGILAAAALALPVAYATETAQPNALGGTWEKVSNDDGILVYRMEVPGSPLVAFRGEAVIDASIAKISNVLIDSTRKLEWVARIVESKDLRQVSTYERVEYNHTSAPWPIKDRDFVFLAKAEFDPAKGTAIFKLKSVDDPAMPHRDNDGIVRGVLHNSAYTMTAIDGGKRTMLTVEIHADPKGSIPTWVVNLFQKSWPHKTLSGIKAQVRKPDVKEHEGIRALYQGHPIPADASATAAN